jgi:hypothetical protein
LESNFNRLSSANRYCRLCALGKNRKDLKLQSAVFGQSVRPFPEVLLAIVSAYPGFYEVMRNESLAGVPNHERGFKDIHKSKYNAGTYLRLVLHSIIDRDPQWPSTLKPFEKFVFFTNAHNSDTSNVLEIRPDGPLRNDPFSLRAGTNNLWVTYGDYSVFYNPYPLRSRGVSHLENEEWVNIPNDSVLGTRNLNSISINPADSDEVFISSFIDGLLEVNNNEASMLYNQFNSGLESLANTGSQPSDIRLSATNFDSQGILWTATGRVDHPLKSFNPSTGQWQLYDFDDIYIDPFEDEWGYCDLVIDRNGNKWLGGYNQGVIGVSGQNFGQRKMNTEEENMPSPFVTSLAIDQRNQLWIGTLKGLRVLYNTAGFFDDDSPEANSIIILEDDIPSELLFQQFITSIEVDGSNNKWVGTFGTGVFYFSSDGQETIYHFTKDNSPLPSNNITDISIDNTNGIVYFATEKGLLSFSSGSSGTKDDLTEAFIYPNPVRPGFDISEDKVKIKDISDNVNIKIVDIEGNLVAEAQSRTNQRFKGYNLEIDGGTAYWNGKNLANNVVASGVYLVMLSDLDTFETKVLKVMIIR